MRVQEGGGLYPFCPGKATWRQDVANVYNALVVCAEMGSHWEAGGIADQPDWWIGLVSWFVPRYNELRFYSRAKAILGDGKGASGGAKQGNSGVPDKNKYR